MPELPEVEFAVRQLRRAIRGRRITALRAHHRAQARTLTPGVVRRCVGRAVADVTRRGKHQLLHLDDGATLLVHFRLDGDWVVSAAATALPKHARVSFDLSATRGADRRASLTDPRALATITYHAPGKPPALDLGPEPEDPAVTAEWLHARFSAKRGPIKPLLLDQRLLAGIGNIYAQEACWRAKLDPAAPAQSLSLAQVKRLLVAIRGALADGHVNAGRYHQGTRPIPFKVYDRDGEPCMRCGAPIIRITQSGRGTYLCPTCQREGARSEGKGKGRRKGAKSKR
jgi:formamidopyrimidine-DNA glycosylase